MSDDLIVLAERIAKTFYRRYPFLNYDEILSNAYEAMVNACISHDPLKGRKLESWIGYKVNQELNKLLRRENPFVNYDPDFMKSELSPEQIVIEYDKLDKLSPLAKRIMNMVFNGQLNTKNDNKNEIKRAIKTKLREQGIAYNKIQKAFTELIQAAHS